jgi:hypothetical protein
LKPRARNSSQPGTALPAARHPLGRHRRWNETVSITSSREQLVHVVDGGIGDVAEEEAEVHPVVFAASMPWRLLPTGRAV